LPYHDSDVRIVGYGIRICPHPREIQEGPKAHQGL
jgi:hypothetical protein